MCGTSTAHAEWLVTGEVWSYRKHGGDKGPLPPLRLRNGVLLKHGEFENPVDLLKEVFLDRWYEWGAKLTADATMVNIGANIGAVSLYWAAGSPFLRIHAYAPNPSALDTLRQNLEADGLRNRMAVFPEAVGAGAGSSIYGWISRLSSRPTISIRHRLRAGVESPCQWWEWRKSGVV
jgi:hypothetical protein